MVALADQGAAEAALLDRPLHLLRALVDRGAVGLQHDPVVVLEIAHPAGEGRQRQRVGADVHLAVAVADRQRAAAARAHQDVVAAAEQRDQREGAAQALHRLAHRLLGRHLALEIARSGAAPPPRCRCRCRSVRPSASSSSFSSWKFSMMPLCTIATRSVAMGWALRSDGLPCVAQRVWPMPIVPAQRLARQPRLEIDQLALGAAALDVAVHQGGDAGRIVAAILEPLQRVDQQGRDGRLADDSDDAAHGRVQEGVGYFVFFLARLAAAARAFSFARSGAARPFFVDLAGPAEGHGAGRHVLGDDAAGRHVGALADLHRRHQRAVGADEGLGADHGPPLAVAVVVHGDGAGADIAAARRCRNRRDRPGDWPWRRGPCGVALSSTKLPIWTSSATSEPGRMRANGPMIAPRADARALDVAEGLDLDVRRHADAGPEAHVGPDRDVGARTSCRPHSQTVSGSVMVTPAAIAAARRRSCSARSATASSARELMPWNSRLLAFDGDRLVAGGARDGDGVGEIEFALCVVVADRAQQRRRSAGRRGTSRRNCRSRSPSRPRRRPCSRRSSRAGRRRTISRP